MTRLSLLQQMLESAPNDAFTLFATAKEYEKATDDQQALQYYERLRQADPDYVGLYYHLGKLLERMEQPARALDAYTQGVAVARKIGDLHALSELNSAKMDLEMETGSD